MKHLSRAWNRMTLEQKEKYKNMSTKDRSRFEEQRRKHKICITSGQPCTCKQSEFDMETLM